ncbi:MAG TPA: pyridoxamine 5'-phosphate oxidase family protein [Jatrophihabitans sp.]|nr:pyridoxamine 5'-phosphate oxidase family protein [Jatrophihabitans sp.]
MSVAEPLGELVAEFSDPDSAALPWADAAAVVESAEMFWLSTVRRDGRPHVVPLPAMWLDGALHFATGAHEQKARNLAANPNCVLTTGTNAFRAGIDVVVEGSATRVTGTRELTRLARMWREKLDWTFEVGDGVFLDAESDGHPALVFALQPTKILAFTKQPYSQTRYVM